MVKEDTFVVKGTIKEALSNANFLVVLENGAQVTAYVGGKMKDHGIRVLVGDTVLVEMSPYDLERGRITFRVK